VLFRVCKPAIVCAMKEQITSEQTLDRASERLLKKAELAERLAVSTRTIDEWQRRGRIAYLKIGRSARYRWAMSLRSSPSFAGSTKAKRVENELRKDGQSDQPAVLTLPQCLQA
jgi:excisionase family DNA binding protein